MTVGYKIRSMLIVGDKQAAAVPRLLKEGNKPVEIAGGGAVSYHNPLSLADTLLGFFRGGTFVVVANTRGNVFVKVAAGEQGRMTVYDLALFVCGIYFRHNALVTENNAHIVHHFCKTENPGMTVERLNIRGGKLRAGFIKGGCRNAGGNHHINIEGQLFACLKHKFKALAAADVRNFVRVGNNGTGSVQHRGLGKLRGKHHGAFNVNMPVNKAGTDVLARNVMNAVRVRVGIITYADYFFILDKYVSLLEFVGEHIYNRSAFQQRFHNKFPLCSV